MKLERLEVTNWRGIDHQVIEFSDGVTIVGGPNECGKTSLRAALYAALLAPLGKSGEKKKLEANRPWKTSLYPKVHLQVNIDGKTCVVEKEFLRKKEWASLRIDGRLIAQDDEVQPNLRKLLGESAEWIDALWGVQGDANLDCPAPESVKGRLADAARDTVMPQVNELEDLLSKEYGEYWTPKTGKPKSSIQELRQATITAEDQVTEIERKIESADQQSAEIDRKDKELEKTRNLLAELAKKWKEGQAALGQWEIYERAQLQATTAKKDAERAQQWLESWKNSLQELPTLTKSSSEWQDLVESLKRELQKEPTREAIDGLTAKKNFLQISIAYDTYTQVNAIQAPNNIELNRLKQLEKTLSEIKARLNAGAMKATLSPEKAPLDVILRVDGKQPASEQLSPPSRKEWTAENSFDLQIPGIARLTVEAGGTDIKADVSKRDEIENELAQVLQCYSKGTRTSVVNRGDRRADENRRCNFRRTSPNSDVAVHRRKEKIGRGGFLGTGGRRKTVEGR
jgi:DNA repair exonuclease SbcCD ATPase subunit